MLNVSARSWSFLRQTLRGRPDGAPLSAISLREMATARRKPEAPQEGEAPSQFFRVAEKLASKTRLARD
jgi:hypothetical protein